MGHCVSSPLRNSYVFLGWTADPKNSSTKHRFVPVSTDFRRRNWPVSQALAVWEARDRSYVSVNNRLIVSKAGVVILTTSPNTVSGICRNTKVCHIRPSRELSVFTVLWFCLQIMKDAGGGCGGGTATVSSKTWLLLPSKHEGLEQGFLTCWSRPLWGLHIRFPAYQIFTLWFLTIAE